MKRYTKGVLMEVLGSHAYSWNERGVVVQFWQSIVDSTPLDLAGSSSSSSSSAAERPEKEKDLRTLMSRLNDLLKKGKRKEVIRLVLMRRL